MGLDFVIVPCWLLPLYLCLPKAALKGRGTLCNMQADTLQQERESQENYLEDSLYHPLLVAQQPSPVFFPPSTTAHNSLLLVVQCRAVAFILFRCGTHL